MAGGGRVFMADIDAKRGAAEKDNFVNEYGKVRYWFIQKQGQNVNKTALNREVSKRKSIE